MGPVRPASKSRLAIVVDPSMTVFMAGTLAGAHGSSRTGARKARWKSLKLWRILGLAPPMLVWITLCDDTRCFHFVIGMP